MKEDICVTLYKLGRIVLIIGLIALPMYYLGAFKALEPYNYCIFKRIVGLYCPGCGGTHAVVSLVTGHPIDSFLAHPFVIYVAVCALIFASVNTVARIRHTRGVSFRMLYVYIGLAILFVQWIVKNI